LPAYKLDIRKQFGQFEHRVYKQGGATPDHAGGARTLKEMVSNARKSLDDAGVTPDDTIIFRNISYEDQEALLLAIRDAPY